MRASRPAARVQMYCIFRRGVTKATIEEIAHALDLLDRAELRADQDLLKA
jgi:hypothetical protein